MGPQATADHKNQREVRSDTDRVISTANLVKSMDQTVSIATYAILRFATAAGTVRYLTRKVARAQALCPTRRLGKSLASILDIRGSNAP